MTNSKAITLSVDRSPSVAKPKTFIPSFKDIEYSRIMPGERRNPFAAALHPPGVAPRAHHMAMDDSLGAAATWANSVYASYLNEGFLGYPELAILAQKPEYRRIVETIAQEMTRAWIKVTAKGDDDKTERVEMIEAAMKQLDVQNVFRRIVEVDGFFGRAHLFIDLGTTDDDNELKLPIGNGRNNLSRNKVQKGGLRALRVIEPVWCYPTNYNSNDPLKASWYRPESWFVQGREVHASRILPFVMREVPDLLKPAYSFGGLSMSQIAKPYVENWLRTRTSVGDLLHSFSVSGIKTDLTELQVAGPGSLATRADHFINMRDNRGLMFLNAETEDFFNVSTPLGTLDALQAQSQEHMASVSGIPLVKLLGIQPAGLNASSEGELECFYTYIKATQEAFFTKNLKIILDFIQLSEFGDVDKSIGFEFEPLDSMNDKELAEIRKLDAETGEVLIRSKAISSVEERKRVAADPETPYSGLDDNEVPREPLTEEQKATVADVITRSVVEAQSAGMISDKIALQELMRQSNITGVFATLTDDDIVEAANAPPEPPPMMPGGAGPGGGDPFSTGGEQNAPGGGGSVVPFRQPAAQAGSLSVAHGGNNQPKPMPPHQPQPAGLRGVAQDAYNPNEERAPSGTETGGQWTKGGANPSQHHATLKLEKNVRGSEAAPAQLSWEAAPGETSSELGGYHGATWEQKVEYTDAIRHVLEDKDGNDVIAKGLGLEVAPSFGGIGVFNGNINPGAQAQVEGSKASLTPEEHQLINIEECVRGILLKQDAVAWHKPQFLPQTLQGPYLIPSLKMGVDANGKAQYVSAGPTHADALKQMTPEQRKAFFNDQAHQIDSNFAFLSDRGQYLSRRAARKYAEENDLLDPSAYQQPDLIAEHLKPEAANPGTRLKAQNVNCLDFDIGHTMTKDEALTISKALQSSGKDYFPPLSTPRGFRLLNVPEATGVDNLAFQDETVRLLGETDLPDAVYHAAYADSDFIANDWSKETKGETYQRCIDAGPPDVQRKAHELLADLGPRLEAVKSDFAKRYGWGEAGGAKPTGAADEGQARVGLDEFNEADHPRGQPDNAGQFVEKAKQVGEVDPEADAEVLDVGGDEWNKALARKLENEYRRALPALKAIEAKAVGGNVTMTRPQTWSDLPSDKQEEAENEWKKANWSSFHDSEVNNWAENDAATEAGRIVADDFNDGTDDQWARDALVDNEVDIGPFDVDTIIGAAHITPPDFGDNSDPEIGFDDSKLIPKNWVDTPSLPGVTPEKPSDKLTPEMRKNIVAHLKEAFDTERTNRQGTLEPPDYLSESVDEQLDEYWGGMPDSEKWQAAVDNDLVGHGDDEDDEGHTYTGKLDKLPEKYDPLNDTTGEDYRRTQAVARFMSNERAKQIMMDRGLTHWNKDSNEREMKTFDSVVAAVDSQLWSAWKSSSTSDEGQLLQLAVAEELGGRLHRKQLQTGDDNLRKFADNDFSSIGGYAGLKAYVRAKWETSQFLLDKAGVKKLNLYRAVQLTDVENSIRMQMETPHETDASKIAPPSEFVPLTTTRMDAMVKDEIVVNAAGLEVGHFNGFADAPTALGAKLMLMKTPDGGEVKVPLVNVRVQPDRPTTSSSPTYVEKVPRPGDPLQSAAYAFRKLPNLELVRNGAASTTTDINVANGWDGADRVVLRAVVPRTAVVSVPAYGINVQSEHEVVVGGTAWVGWDAWHRKAPAHNVIPLGVHNPSIVKGTAPKPTSPQTEDIPMQGTPKSTVVQHGALKGATIHEGDEVHMEYAPGLVYKYKVNEVKSNGDIVVQNTEGTKTAPFPYSAAGVSKTLKKIVSPAYGVAAE